MTLLAPGYLLVAALAGLAVLLLHTIVTREPRTLPLPTARFAPDTAALARPRAVQPSDLLLLALRVLMILLIGAALAQPIIHPPRRPVTRVVLADRSAAADSAAVASELSRIAATSDTVIPFDSGGISAALIMGLRTASSLRAGTDSFELVVVSPLLASQLDDATDSIRALWPAAIRLIRTGERGNGGTGEQEGNGGEQGHRGTGERESVRFSGSADDPLRFAFGDRIAADGAVRLVRGAEAGPPVPGGVLVHWPAAVTPGETVGAVSAGDAVVVAPFERAAALPVPAGARVVARWVDGLPAAYEVAVGTGCVRTVMVQVPSRGDLVLTPRFARFAAALTGPCGGRIDLTPASEAQVASLTGPSAPPLAASIAIAAPDLIRSALTRWLLIAALLVAVVELLVRRGSGATT